MIRREAGDDWLLISQVDHAHLAADIAMVWGNDTTVSLPNQSLLIRAIRDHDDGWKEWEATPRIDPNLGWPRNFTEMPMQEATEIWSKSIERCANGESSLEGTANYLQQFLQMRGRTLSRDMESILNTIATIHIPFSVEQIVTQIRGPAIYKLEQTVHQSLKVLEEARVIKRAPNLFAQSEYERQFYLNDFESHRTSPLSGSWVSRHFCWLAEKAKESRAADPDELKFVDRFLAEERIQQLAWLANPGFKTTAAEFTRQSKAGFRWVQFFDRLSLWICCAKRTDPFDVVAPDGTQYVCIPHHGNRFIIDPYPLSVDELQLSVSAHHIPANVFADDEELQDAIQNAGVEELTWTISR